MKNLKLAISLGAGAILAFSTTTFGMKCHMDSTECAAQCTTTVKAETVHFVGGGVKFFAIDKFNTSLGNNGLSSYSDMTGVITLGEEKMEGRGVSGSNMNISFWKNRVNGNVKTSLWTAQCMTTCGVNVFDPAKNLGLFPQFGFGIGVSMLHIGANEKTFGEALAAPVHNEYLWQVVPLLQAGVGLDLKSRKIPETNICLVGIRTGYTWAFAHTRWWDENATITNLNALDHDGFYATLVLGVGTNKISKGKCPMKGRCQDND